MEIICKKCGRELPVEVRQYGFTMALKIEVCKCAYEDCTGIGCALLQERDSNIYNIRERCGQLSANLKALIGELDKGGENG